MKVLKCVFPTGALLTVGGVFLCAPLEWHSFDNTQDWEYAILSKSFLRALLLGTVLVLIGSVLDRRRLPITETRARGITCWLACGVSLLLLVKGGNVHGWTITFMGPAFVGFVAGAVLLSKLTERNPGTKPPTPPLTLGKFECTGRVMGN
jgi:ABC-type Fe3+-siderophore transport system permease subunit